jgi:trimeric autotransporter adhesin
VKRAIPFLVVALVLTAPGIAWAAWVTNGSGAGRAKGGTLPTWPTPSSTTITSSAITLTWSDVTVGGQPLSTLTGGRYVVSRNGGASSAGCGGASGIAATTCVESGLSPATTYTFTIAAKLGNWVGNAGTSVSPTTLTAPTVVSTNPSSRGQGTANQTITVTGTGFVSGATVSISGSGISVNSTSFASATQLSANVTISSGASAHARSPSRTRTASRARARRASR